MKLHLEIAGDDLEETLRRAISLGAMAADVQPQDDVRICLDPAGTPSSRYVRD